jgi:hypothetical protein
VVAVLEVEFVLGDMVVEVGELAGAVPGVAVADGENVATNGVRNGDGSTTGTLSTWRVSAGVPNCTVVDPLAATFWTVPTDNSPAHNVAPVATDPTWTQHEPVPVTVI